MPQFPFKNLPESCPEAASLWDNLCLHISRVGPAGLMPAPGTWGALVALVFAPIWFLPLPMLGRVLVLLALFLGGALVSTRAEKILACKDPSQIVIDEFLGMWLVLLPFKEITPLQWGLAFVLFRFFDICKPWPVSASEHWMREGYGIMLDDTIAACMALIVLGFLCWMGWK